jgi:hypothetical protein
MSSKDREDADSLFGMNTEEWLVQVPVRLITAMTLSKLKLLQPCRAFYFAIDAGNSRLKIETDASNSNSTHTSSSFDMVVNVVIFS